MRQLPPQSTNRATASPIAEPTQAMDAVALLLGPLARLMIDHGIQLPAMIELVKRSLVDEAERSFSLANKDSTDSRVSLLTGVHRKDVKRLRSAPHSATPVNAMVSVSAAVVARWISEPRFLTANQMPRPLARTPTRMNDGEPDFTQLVAEVSRDVGARAVLDELVRLDVVALQADGHVALNSSAFVPREGLGESFHFLAANVSDHLAAAVHNLTPGGSGAAMLEQSGFSHNLSPAQVDELQVLARRLWARVLQQFLQAAAVAEQRSASSKAPPRRVRFGVYFHHEPQAANTTTTESIGKPKKNKGKPS